MSEVPPYPKPAGRMDPSATLKSSTPIRPVQVTLTVGMHLYSLTLLLQT